MQLELAQIPLVDGVVAPNLARTLDAIGKRRAGTDLLVFPEATLTGFPTRENVRDVAETLSGPSLGAVRDAARNARTAVAVGLAERDSGDGERFYNTTVLIDERGDIALRYRKTHLWATDVGVFTPGDRFEVCEFKGITVGLLICYDIEFPESARALGMLGAEMLVVTNGNMNPFGPVHRRAIVARAMENQAFAALVNRTGDGDDNLTFPGESALISPFGDVLAELGSEDAVLPVTVDRALLAQSREHYSYVHDARIALNLADENNAQGRRTLNIRPRTTR